jgi:iron(III) transport system substrate-binding protein
MNAPNRGKRLLPRRGSLSIASDGVRQFSTCRQMAKMTRSSKKRMQSFLSRRLSRRINLLLAPALVVLLHASCSRQPADEVVVYCGVDEPTASKVFDDFEKLTGIRVAVRYDIEASKSVGLAGRLEAEADHPQADVWWGSEAFLSVRLAGQDVLTPYQSPAAQDIPPRYKDAGGLWTGVALRARVLAVAQGSAAPPFPVSGIRDLADSRLKDKTAMSRPTAGATGAHLAALYALWGPRDARAFFQQLHDNGITLLGGNAEVADQVGNGIYSLGLTDSDSISTAQSNGGHLKMVIPDQAGDGALAMPTTVALVKGARHPDLAKKLIDFLLGRRAEQRLVDMNYARWSVRGEGADSIRAMKVDYTAAAAQFARAQREGTALLEGRGAE